MFCRCLPIGGTGKTTDSGWGCTIRCGQMLLAEALVRRHLGSGTLRMDLEKGMSVLLLVLVGPSGVICTVWSNNCVVGCRTTDSVSICHCMLL